jgi:hypothetical protein
VSSSAASGCDTSRSRGLGSQAAHIASLIHCRPVPCPLKGSHRAADRRGLGPPSRRGLHDRASEAGVTERSAAGARKIWSCAFDTPLRIACRALTGSQDRGARSASEPMTSLPQPSSPHLSAAASYHRRGRQVASSSWRVRNWHWRLRSYRLNRYISDLEQGSGSV